MRTKEELACVLDLDRDGLGASAIRRITGIPRSTIRDWLAGRGLAQRSREQTDPARTLPLLESEASYAYLLGMYLGDGHLSEMQRGVFRLRITLDAKYGGIIREAAAAVQRVLPTNKVSVQPLRHENAVIVVCYSKQWPGLLPQHGPGRKHERRIALLAWQEAVIGRHRHAFVRGLLHSDGSRFVAHQRGRGARRRVIYKYPRYSFVNRSADILRIMGSSLDRLGICWTYARPDAIQIARRSSVARLDAFVGPKL